MARDLFIRHALVQGEWRTHHRFWARNQALMEEAEDLENRSRRRDIVVDEETLFDLYDERVPAQVVSTAHFDSWWKTEKRTPARPADASPSTCCVHESAAEVTTDDFPTEWQHGEAVLPLDYTFEPGSADDGVTVDIPVATLNAVDRRRTSPGRCPACGYDLVVALMRSLPKQLRVNFVPAPNVARDFLGATTPGEEPLLDALERFLLRTHGRGGDAGGVGPRQGARPPPAVVPGSRRRRRGAGHRQGPRGAAALLRAGHTRAAVAVGRGSSLERTGLTQLGHRRGAA